MSITSATTKSLPIFTVKCEGYTAKNLSDLMRKRGEKMLRYRFHDRNETGAHTPLFYTVRKLGDMDLVSELLNLGADADEMDPDFGGTALHAFMATLLNTPIKVDILKILLAHTKNVNAISKRGFTPLHLAAYYFMGDWEVIQLLLKAGADPYAKTNDRKTPLDVLCERRKEKDRVEQLKKEYLRQVESFSTVLPEMATEAERQVKLKALAQEVNVLASKVFFPTVLPNPCATPDIWQQEELKKRGIIQIREHMASLSYLTPKIHQMCDLSQKLDAVPLSPCFTDQEFSNLEKIYRDDFKILTLLKTLKKSKE